MGRNDFPLYLQRGQRGKYLRAVFLRTLAIGTLAVIAVTAAANTVMTRPNVIALAGAGLLIVLVVAGLVTWNIHDQLPPEWDRDERGVRFWVTPDGLIHNDPADTQAHCQKILDDDRPAPP